MSYSALSNAQSVFQKLQPRFSSFQGLNYVRVLRYEKTKAPANKSWRLTKAGVRDSTLLLSQFNVLFERFNNRN